MNDEMKFYFACKIFGKSYDAEHGAMMDAHFNIVLGKGVKGLIDHSLPDDHPNKTLFCLSDIGKIIDYKGIRNLVLEQKVPDRCVFKYNINRLPTNLELRTFETPDDLKNNTAPNGTEFKSSSRGNPEMIFVNWEAVDIILMTAATPKALEFRKWALMVIESVRVNGAYIDHETIQKIKGDPTVIESLETRLAQREQDYMQERDKAIHWERLYNSASESLKDLELKLGYSTKKVARRDTKIEKLKSTIEGYRDLVSQHTTRISELEKELHEAEEKETPENNAAFNQPKVQMCHVVDNTHKKTNIMDIINGYKGE